MDWQVHYQSGGQEFRAAAADKQTAICVACILLRDGHDVMKVESQTGEMIEPDEIKRLCGR